ncbi:hypothetical protein FRC09_001277, partial [Ceratobasidium sp. 395]
GASQCTTLTCTAGKYPSGNSCANCAAGSYSTNGAKICSDCPAGTISNAGSSTCTICPGGTVPASTGNSCTTCATNTYSSGDYCLPCLAGQTSPRGSSSCGPQPSKRAVQPILDTCSLIPGHRLCPVLSGGGGSECINILTTLDSCGGCVGLDGEDEDVFAGRDCSAIPNVDEVNCEQGRCKIVSCRVGYMAGQGICSPLPHSKTRRVNLAHVHHDSF